jgi:uncharacterized membrane protein
VTSPWALLPFALVSLCLGSWLSYHKAFKASPWFPAIMAGLFVANGLLWSWMCRRAADGRELFSVSIAYDAITIVAYSVLPLAVFGVRLTPAAWVGFGLVVAGACLVKWGG